MYSIINALLVALEITEVWGLLQSPASQPVAVSQGCFMEHLPCLSRSYVGAFRDLDKAPCIVQGSTTYCLGASKSRGEVSYSSNLTVLGISGMVLLVHSHDGLPSRFEITSASLGFLPTLLTCSQGSCCNASFFCACMCVSVVYASELQFPSFA